MQVLGGTLGMCCLAASGSFVRAWHDCAEAVLPDAAVGRRLSECDQMLSN